MNFSLLQNLQLNKGQKTLSTMQQEQLIKVTEGLLVTNYAPRMGSILIVRAWEDGTFEKILAGNLIDGKARGCNTQAFKGRKDRGEERLVNDVRYDSAEFVGHEVSEALQCDDPRSFYHNRIKSDVGSVYAEYGHYVLSLPIEDGRIIASFRASYFRCDRPKHNNRRRRHGQIQSSVDEAWQHQLMLISLAEALRMIMCDDTHLDDAFYGILCDDLNLSGHIAGYEENSKLIQRCLRHRSAAVHAKINIDNSKLPYARRYYASAIAAGLG